jgi:hypothetical protein
MILRYGTEGGEVKVVLAVRPDVVGGVPADLELFRTPVQTVRPGER